jgi:RES domain-containing protein
VKAWRIASRKYAATAFTGEGAARYPGRWNKSGVPVIYLATSMAVGILEILVHVTDRSYLNAYVAIPVSIPDAFIEKLEPLPENWQQLSRTLSRINAGRRYSVGNEFAFPCLASTFCDCAQRV